MTLQQVFDFLAVAQHGSLHGAARASRQTQPALSRSLRKLEEDLGAPLFTRHAKGIQLTEFGTQFMVHARLIATETRRAQESVAQMRGGKLGRVQYGISAAPSILLAPAAIARFRRQYPDVELLSRSGLYHSLAPLLRDGHIDFAISPTPEGPHDAGFVATTLITSEMVLVARRQNPRARARSLHALKDAAFVIGAPRGVPGAGIYDAFKRAGLGVPKVEVQTDSLIDTLALLAATDYFGLIPAVLQRSGFMKDTLVTVPIEETLPAYRVKLFRRRDQPLTPAARALVTQFEREAAYLRK